MRGLFYMHFLFLSYCNAKLSSCRQNTNNPLFVPQHIIYVFESRAFLAVRFILLQDTAGKE